MERYEHIKWTCFLPMPKGRGSRAGFRWTTKGSEAIQYLCPMHGPVDAAYVWDVGGPRCAIIEPSGHHCGKSLEPRLPMRLEYPLEKENSP